MPPKGKPKAKTLKGKAKSTAGISNTSSARIFKGWKDEDFYGPKAFHIYLYGIISAQSVQDFRVQLHEACKPVKSAQGLNLKPRPVVIHLHSPGGAATLGITLANVIREVSVPLAVVVDGYACSAATPLLVSASYRVMHEFSFALFHEVSVMFDNVPVKNVDLGFIAENIDGMIREYKRIYSLNTNITQTQLDELILRDIFLDAKFCAKNKVVDRVIQLSKAKSHARWKEYMDTYPDINITKNPLSWKPFLNHLFSHESTNTLMLSSADANAEALLRIIKPMHLVQQDQSASTPTPIVLHTNTFFTPTERWFDMATLMIHVYSMPVPVVGIIDSNIDIMKAIPTIMSHKRYMYDNAYINISLLYTHQSTGGKYYHDIKYNTEVLRSTLQSLLRQYTRMPASMLDTLFDKRINLSAKECKDYGLVDDIITPKQRNQITKMTGGCGCSQGLAYAV